MRRLFIAIWIGLLIIGICGSAGLSREARKVKRLKVTSPSFENNQTIPKKYGCDGENVNPPIRIDQVPAEAKSMALVFDDKDAPRGSYVHWILWNIDPSVKEIKENSVPEGAIQGTNDFKENTYGGPCPPTRLHKYIVRVYALDTQLTLDPKSMKVELEKAMEGHLIAQGQLMGVYKRDKKK